MANVLTDLAADIYVAADVVARELVGAIPSITINANGSERVALNDVVRAAFTRPATVVNVAPSMTVPEGTDQTIDNKTLSITKARSVQIPWTGEDMRSVNNGAGFQTIYGDQIAQAMRALTNEMEIDVMNAAYRGASRAIGVTNATPFANNFNEVAQLRKILADNGTPMDGQVTMVLNTTAGVNLRNLAQLQKANENGSDQLLRQGTLLDLQGIMLKESAGVPNHTAGTGTAFETTADYAVGVRSLVLDTGTGTILPGDVVTFAGSTIQYVVESFSGGTLVLGAPGLRAPVANNTVVTVVGSSARNVVFHRRSVELAVRPPAVPNGGDIADDAMVIQDPFSGIVYEIRAYKGYRKSMFEVAAAWGVKSWKSEFIAQLIGQTA